MSDKERVHFKIALPTGLKAQLEHAAVDNRRSLSAEIIARLEATLELNIPGPDVRSGFETDADSRYQAADDAAERAIEKFVLKLLDIPLEDATEDTREAAVGWFLKRLIKERASSQES